MKTVVSGHSLLSENNKILLHMNNENSSLWTQFITARNSSCRKVMFSQTYVIPSVHGEGGLPGGVCIQGRLPGGEFCIQGVPRMTGVCIQGVGQTPPQILYYGIRSTSGRYASYSNAFLVEN